MVDNGLYAMFVCLLTTHDQKCPDFEFRMKVCTSWPVPSFSLPECNGLNLSTQPRGRACAIDGTRIRMQMCINVAE